MKIIRDEEAGGLLMIPLFVDWGIRRCNVAGCTNKPAAIVTESGDDIPIYGLCEEHFQAANTPGGTMLNLEWDDFDAFKYQREKEKAETERAPQFPYRCNECGEGFMGGQGAMPGDLCPVCSFGHIINAEVEA